MTLTLEIEYLSGVSYSSRGPGRSGVEWPPEIDRIFSGLVATWAYHGQREPEKRALEWFERLPPPKVYASPATHRTSAVTYVPPNDPSSLKPRRRKGQLKTVSLTVRWRQPRRFPAVRPENPIIRLVWPDVTCDRFVSTTLDSLARDTSYIGHSASLTRCHFILSSTSVDLSTSVLPKRSVYPGRLAELRSAFAAGRRPSPGHQIRSANTVADGGRPGSAFGADWMVLEVVGDKILDIRAHAVVAQQLRSVIVAGYHNLGLGDRVPAEITGRSSDGLTSPNSHLAIVPLAFVGFRHADGHLLGMALVPPRDSGILRDPDFLKVMRAISERRSDGRRMVRLSFEMEAITRSFDWVLTVQPSRASTDPSRFLQAGITFATVTPLVLNRYPKKRGEEREREIVEQIVESCRHSGLPEPAVMTVSGQQHPLVKVAPYSSIEAAPPARIGGTRPPWTHWQMPHHLDKRALTHAIIQFARPVAGPVIVGAGRFLGLGLCLPVDGSGGRGGQPRWTQT